MIYLWVGVAGGVGAMARFGIARYAQSVGWAAFPFATLLVNVLGSFLIGYFAIVLQQKWGLSDSLKVALISGFLGGFTTFSAFSLETIQLIEQGALMKSFFYIAATLVLCLAACGAGYILGLRST